MHLRNLIETTKKKSLSINEFVPKMKGYADSLSASGVFISFEELVTYILDGLGPEYDAVSVHLSARGDDITLQEAHFLLHKHEIKLERYNNVHGMYHDNSAFLAQKQNLINSFCGHNSGYSSCNHSVPYPAQIVNTAPITHSVSGSSYYHNPDENFNSLIAQDVRRLNPNLDKGRGRNFFKRCIVKLFVETRTDCCTMLKFMK